MSNVSPLDGAVGFPVKVSAFRATPSYVQRSTESVIFVLPWSDRGALPGAQSLDSFLDEAFSDPDIAAHLAEVQTDLANQIAETEGGDTLRSLRLRNGMSQTDLASQIGATQAAISEYERGIREAGFGVLKALASALHVDANTLFKAIENGQP